MSKMQELPARQSVSSKGRCAGLFVCRHGGKRVEDSERSEGVGR